MSQDDKIAPPKRSPSFARALRGSVRRNFWPILLFFTLLGMFAIRGFSEGNMRYWLIEFVALLVIGLFIAKTLGPEIRKQNEAERLKRDTAPKP